MRTIDGSRHGKKLAFGLLIAFLLVGGYVRSAGLFRGLNDGVIPHPDTPKQIMMLDNHLRGNYVLYMDNRFYDGYPYGLNRVDEWLIRPLYGVVRAWRAWLTPDFPTPPIPARFDLYRWARALRVVYGLAAVLLLYAAARRLGAPPVPATAAAGLYALAPLGAAVTHSASGDVGVDLFLALALWCLARYGARQSDRWLAAAGAACGMAFACKFQGALGLWMVALPPLLLLKPNRAAFLALFRRGAAAAVGLAAGALVLTPAYFINPARTWRDTLANFAFIRDYNVPAEFLEKPLTERAAHGLSRNVPFVLGSLGWALAAGALLALVLFGLRRVRARKRARPDAAPDTSPTLAAVALAIASFPFVALLMAPALKPNVHPFHFSFLLPPMALSTGLALDRSVRGRPLVFRAGIPLLLALFALESFFVHRREHFFWRRGDTFAAALRFANGTFLDNPQPVLRYDPNRFLKYFHAEPARLPVFRNRTASLPYRQAHVWRERHILPVPPVPLAEEHSWMFVNGPVFPRSDRMFFVPADLRTGHDLHGIASRHPGKRRTAVYEAAHPNVRLGLRAGRLPARVEIVVSGARKEAWLPPHTQTVLEWPNARARFGGEYEGRAAWPVPIRVRSELGPVWIAVLDRDSEQAVFDAFGPDADRHAPALAPEFRANTLRAALNHLRYVEYEDVSVALAPNQSVPLLDPATPLAGGAYVLYATVLNNGAAQPLRFELAPAHDQPAHAAFETTVEPGPHRLVWRFRKNFFPFDPSLRATARGAGLTLLAWRIVPDPDALGEWLAHPPAAPDTEADGEEPVAFSVAYPGLGRWEGLVLPRRAEPGARIRHAIRFRLDPKIAHKKLHETLAFLHMRNENGERVAVFEYFLRDALAPPGRLAWQTAELPSDLAPGRYRLEGGLYNGRTRKRHWFRGAVPEPANRMRRVFTAAELEVGH